MTKVILSINAGSSSVKISVYTASPQNNDPLQIAEADVSGLTAAPTQLNYKRRGETVAKNKVLSTKAESQEYAFTELLRALIEDSGLPEISQKSDIALACHRIVHGGDYITSKVINQHTYHHLEALADLAPLHNRHALEIVRSCVSELSDATNVACFDSEFHASIPEHIRTYPIDPGVARQRRLRKYGFHGISYRFIVRAVAGYLGKDPSTLNIIALHLGSGASACAIKGGKSWDTSMGLTPLAGLPGATRSGSVDPSLVFHYTGNAETLSPTSTTALHITRAEEILNTQSGWAALTGTTNFQTIVSGLEENPKYKLAFELFINRVCGYVGSYYVALGGRIDALVFAGGIGERSDALRDAVISQAGCLGFELDRAANAQKIENTVQDVGAKGSRHRVLVCLTDEQLEMARSCAGAENAELWK
ncbi:acetate kinase [Xylaria sp. CBS 124048]|nr:acetate kinase [Xylaria sp. CBS 124048]